MPNRTRAILLRMQLEGNCTQEGAAAAHGTGGGHGALMGSSVGGHCRGLLIKGGPGTFG